MIPEGIVLAIGFRSCYTDKMQKRMVFKENTGLKKIVWLFLVLLLFAALFVFVYINPFPAMMEVFSPLSCDTAAYNSSSSIP